MPHILLAMTGSVATRLADKIIPALQELGEVKVVMSEAALRFANPLTLHKRHAVDVYTATHEWSFTHYNNGLGKKPGFIGSEWDGDPSQETHLETESADDWLTVSGELWQKNMQVLHIELRKWADVLCVAPLSANTLGLMANGLAPMNSVTACVFRAWDMTKPVVVAPAMNTLMWDNPFTERHLNELRGLLNVPMLNKVARENFFVVEPVSKILACGDEGKGALANSSDIAAAVEKSLQWTWPFGHWTACRGIPVGHHPGAFGFARRTAHHTGVDLYCDEGQIVYAAEGGVVVGINPFTGPQINRPKWNDTDAVFVEGRSGVINYGEVVPRLDLQVGDRIRRGEMVGYVTPVIIKGRERPDVPGHSRSMLHFEWYPHGHTDWTPWMVGETEHAQIDPTELLLNIEGAPGPWPEFEGEL